MLKLWFLCDEIHRRVPSHKENIILREERATRYPVRNCSYVFYTGESSFQVFEVGNISKYTKKSEGCTYEVSPKKSDYICIHSIFGNSSYASFLVVFLFTSVEPFQQKYVKNRAVFPFNSHHLKLPVVPAGSSRVTGVLL